METGTRKQPKRASKAERQRGWTIGETSDARETEKEWKSRLWRKRRESAGTGGWGRKPRGDPRKGFALHVSSWIPSALTRVPVDYLRLSRTEVLIARRCSPSLNWAVESFAQPTVTENGPEKDELSITGATGAHIELPSTLEYSAWKKLGKRSQFRSENRNSSRRKTGCIFHPNENWGLRKSGKLNFYRRRSQRSTFFPCDTQQRGWPRLAGAAWVPVVGISDTLWQTQIANRPTVELKFEKNQQSTDINAELKLAAFIANKSLNSEITKFDNDSATQK